MTTPKIILTVDWGTYKDHRTTHKFNTQEEVDAFLLGATESNGWDTFEVDEMASCVRYTNE
jgi:hypothetical protein